MCVPTVKNEVLSSRGVRLTSARNRHAHRGSCCCLFWFWSVSYLWWYRCETRVQANPWGFVDILGNVNEWCSNWYDPKFYLEAKRNEPIKAAFDDRAAGESHAYRGGCWDSSPGQANVYVRGGFPHPIDVIGFRVARDPLGKP